MFTVAPGRGMIVNGERLTRFKGLFLSPWINVYPITLGVPRLTT